MNALLEIEQQDDEGKWTNIDIQYTEILWKLNSIIQ
jgi:hypothetical protein